MGWQIFNAVAALISFALLALKTLADWIGRTTVPEDASGLQGKAIQMFNWVADQPALLFYGLPAGLFVVTAWQLAQRWHDANAPVVFGSAEMAAGPNGASVVLPLRVRAWQGIPCRVTMRLFHLDGQRVRPSFVLVSEQEALRESRRIGRVTLDDTFKEFELFSYDARRNTMHITSEPGNFTIPVRDYRSTVTVTGAGPARSKNYLLQFGDSGFRFSDGTQRGAFSVEFKIQNETTAAPMSAHDVARALDKLFQEGTKLCNSLIPPIPDFDRVGERQKFDEWNNRAVAQLESEHITPKDYSRFKTLFRWNPGFRAVPGKSNEQAHLETMWTEKLKRLRDIIDRVGS